MKRNALSLYCSLALLAGMQVPAFAADWNYGAGSLKDGGYGAAAVAVPAPAPIPVYHADYYFRADIGIGVGDNADVTERGLVYGQDSNSGTFGVKPSWFNNDFETFLTLGVGVGNYWNDSFRTDFTAESRSRDLTKINGSYAFTRPNGANTFDVQGNTFDETKLRGGIFLFNAYYDFNQFAAYALRPYIGAGVGFAWNHVTRKHRTSELECDSTAVPNCTPNIARGSFSDDEKSDTLTAAAAATVGFTYKLSHNASLDMNYRFLYINGVHAGLDISGPQFGGHSVVEIDDTFEHQLRAGVRYDIN